MEPFPLIRGRAGFGSPKALAEYLEVSTITAKRWDQKGPPKAVKLLMQILGRDLSWLGETWEGIYFDHEGYLKGATRARLHGGDLRAIERMEAIIAIHERERLEARHDAEIFKRFQGAVRAAIEAGKHMPPRPPGVRPSRSKRILERRERRWLRRA
ncbi:MAG: hypothetical protein PHH11_11490 [Methylomonas sp.]|nr:hypothetical protein [Methylomonas sp.]